MQKSLKTVTYDGFYAHKWGQPTIVTIAPPIQIFHPVFQAFLDRVDNPIMFEPDEIALSVVSELMPLVSEISPLEENALERLRPLFGRLLNRPVGMVAPTGTRPSDGMVLKTVGRHVVPLLTIEYTSVFGEGG